MLFLILNKRTTNGAATEQVNDGIQIGKDEMKYPRSGFSISD